MQYRGSAEIKERPATPWSADLLQFLFEGKPHENTIAFEEREPFYERNELIAVFALLLRELVTVQAQELCIFLAFASVRV